MAQTPRAPRITARGAGTHRASGGHFRPAGATPMWRSSPRSARSTRSTAGAQSRRRRLRRRTQPQKNGIARTVTGLLPTPAASKATPSSRKGKVGGLVALAAAAGVAFRNRDKLAALVNRNSGQDTHDEAPLASPTTTPASPTPPAHTTEA
jgi:hypothetical protein